MSTYTRVSVTSSLEDTQNKVHELHNEGFKKDHIYVLTHSADGTDYVAEHTGAEQITMAEEGLFTSIANLFRSRGDELKAKIMALGVPEEESARLTNELEWGKILVLATPELKEDDTLLMYQSNVFQPPY
ncbi:hypothetical protein A8709_09895 [Paenibacillus pectinilyticus]|uniref:General stress protein 17M-like domain-containing protein n=1 Tax=Paenibacillus pectinilyticus TaxID=512399 RepID=A0A1C1A5U0_9BACL|nr:general stress protein [Paenibacillus pectinilyticus]OCT15926.1 hypothetical protein A8709_09895 [Paenibacillus pectinilyticus]